MVRYGSLLWSSICLGIIISGSHGAKYYGKLIGEFHRGAHDVKGTVYAANENTLVISDFSYDGQGPDAYFWAGTNGEPSPDGFIVPDEEGSTEVLQSYTTQDVVLKLPDGKRVQDLKWFSVWCRKFTANFGSVKIPENFEPPREQTIGPLPTFAHGVRSGPVVVKDAKTIYIPDLYYDGAAPDAFFLVGNGTTPTHHGAVKVPIESGSAERIKQGYTGESVTLTLPDNLTVFDIDWLSIYCVTFQENFGHVTFAKDLNVPPVLAQLMSKAGQNSRDNQVLPTGRYFGKFIGQFRPSQHNVKGVVYAASENTFFIEGFSYDGAGPDAFFWAGSTPTPSAQGFIVPDEQDSTNVLKSYDNQNLVITLPDGKKIRDIRWFGVWCRKFNADFGHVVIPNSQDIPKEKTLERIPTYAHGVRSGPVVLKDAKTIYIPDLYYDGAAPDAFFLVGNGSNPHERGVKVPDEEGRLTKLKGYNGKSITLRLPGDLTFYDIRWFSLFCITYRENFGHVIIPRTMNIPADLHALRSYGLQLDNCEELFPDRLQVSWKINGKDIYIKLMGRAGDNDYFAFGISGHPTRSKMIGADVTLVYFDNQQQLARAVDYTLNAQSQCSEGNGACPDTKVNSQNDVELISWQRKAGILSVTYKRPLSTGDPQDQIYRSQEAMSVVSAIGPLNSQLEAAYHTTYYNKNTINIHFGRPSQNKCVPFKSEGSKSASTGHGWPPQTVKGVDVFRAQIGPTGGSKGYTAITGIQSWGLAWWINGKLIPEITVQRGRNYTFIVEGGSDPTIPASYHPLYITNNPEGGGAQFVKELNSQKHLIYAGIRRDAQENVIPVGVGRLCEFKHKSVDMAEQSKTFEDYNKTLKLMCETGKPGEFTWMPDDSTPDTVYYQCFTHRNLGWKIRVTRHHETLDEDGARSIVATSSLLLLCLLVTWLRERTQ